MCYFITPLLQLYRDAYIKNTKISWFKYLSLGIILISIIFKLFIKFYNPAWIVCYFMGYAIGAKENSVIDKDNKFKIILGLVALLVNVFQVFIKYYKNITFPGCDILYDYNHVLLGVFIFILLKDFFTRLNMDKLYKILRLSDKYSYEVYLVHQPLILGSFSLLKLTDIDAVNILLVILGIAILAIILKKIELKCYDCIEKRYSLL